MRYDAYTEAYGKSVIKKDLPTVAPVRANTISSLWSKYFSGSSVLVMGQYPNSHNHSECL